MPTKRKASPLGSRTTSDIKTSRTPSPPKMPKDEPDPLPSQGVSTDTDEWDEEETAGTASTVIGEEPEKKKLKTGRAPRFDELKSFKGQTYTGMAIGGSHHWTYDSGQWDETKEEPDLWKIKFEARKHRNRHAPKGSGAPVGTEYHWLIVAHQFVMKEDEDTYSTRMEGRKYKLAYKSVGSNSWSVNTVKGQREREVELLEDAKSRVLGLPPVIGTQKVSSHKKKDPGQRTLEQVIKGGARTKEGARIKGGARKRVESEEAKGDTSDKVSD